MTTHETRDIEVLSTTRCWELLRESVVGRLAVTVDGGPDIFPVNPVVDHGTIVFRTSAGTKLAAAKGRDVAFEVDGYDISTAQAWSVVVKGRAHEISSLGSPGASHGSCASNPRASPVEGSLSSAGSLLRSRTTSRRSPSRPSKPTPERRS